MDIVRNQNINTDLVHSLYLIIQPPVNYRTLLFSSGNQIVEVLYMVASFWIHMCFLSRGLKHWRWHFGHWNKPLRKVLWVKCRDCPHVSVPLYPNSGRSVVVACPTVGITEVSCSGSNALFFSSHNPGTGKPLPALSQMLAKTVDRRNQNWPLEREVTWLLFCSPRGPEAKAPSWPLNSLRQVCLRNDCGKMNRVAAPCPTALREEGKYCSGRGQWPFSGVKIPARKLGVECQAQWRCCTAVHPPFNYRTTTLHFILKGMLFLFH